MSASGIKAGRAFVELFADSNKLYRALDQAQRRVQQFAAATAKIGAGIAGAGVAVLAPLGAIFADTVGHFDKFNDTAVKLGTSTEAFSQLVHGAEMSGAAFEDVETGALKMQKAIAENSDALASLGLDAAKLRGLPLDEQFGLIADALQKVDQESKIDLAMAIFGKGGATLLPMLADGSAGLRDFAAESDRLGKTVNGIDAAKGARVADAFDKAWGATKSTLREVGAAILDVVGEIEKVVEGIIDATRDLRDFIRANRETVLAVTAVAAGMVVGGVAMVGFAGAISITTTIAGAGIVVLKALAATVLFLTSPLGLAVVAATALGVGLAYLWSQTSQGKAVLGELTVSFGEFTEWVKSSWKGMTDAISAGDWSLAFRIGIASADVAWKFFVATLTFAWVEFKGVFVDTWEEATTAIARLFVDLGAAVLRNTMGVLAGIIKAFNSIAPEELQVKIGGLLDDDAINQNRDRLKKAIDDDAKITKKGRDAFREEQKNKSIAELERAQAELDRLKAEAEAKSGGLGKFGLDSIVGGVGSVKAGGESPLPSATQLSAASKGIFGGGNAAGQLGYGDTIAQDTLAASKKTAANSDKQVALLEKIEAKPPEVWS